MDTELRHMRSLKLHRIDVAEGLMQPLPIIEHLDERKHVRLDFLSRVILPLMHQLILERTEETLYDCIVVTVPLAAHAGDQPGLRQLPLVRHTGVRGALIGVMNAPRARSAVRHRHVQGRQSHVLIGPWAHGPSDHAARVQVQDHGQVHPARARRNRGQIARPDPIGRGGHKDLLEPVRRRGYELMMRDHHALRKAGQDLAKKLNVTPEMPAGDNSAAAAKAWQDSLTAMAKGADFDKHYIAHEVTYHEAVLATAQAGLAAAQNAELKALITKAAPNIQAHLDHAKSIQSKMGGMAPGGAMAMDSGMKMKKP